MCDNKENIEILKQKLKLAMKITMIKEENTLKQRNNERAIIDELSSLNKENDQLKEKVEELIIKIAQTMNQISMIEICKSSEKIKAEAHIVSLTSYGEEFQQYFNKERDLTALRNKESIEKEKEQEQIKQRQITEKNEQQAREITAIELEYEIIEQECAVLKKRNNAIMLKLRRKLLETENARRELMKQYGEA